MNDQLISNHLESFLTDDRKQRIAQVLENRTCYITALTEDIFQSQNASAVVRTCDCLGIQDIHIVENRNRYTLNPDVIKGADGWLTLSKYRSSEEAVSQLKKNGYRILATSPHVATTSINDVDLSKGKVAIIFGNEKMGVSDYIKSVADESITIPMYGFTESYNISVSAAITLYTLVNKLRASTIDWHLSSQEVGELKLKWLRSTIKKSHLIEKRFCEENNLMVD